jgi:hypothetical protein
MLGHSHSQRLTKFLSYSNLPGTPSSPLETWKHPSAAVGVRHSGCPWLLLNRNPNVYPQPPQKH